MNISLPSKVNTIISQLISHGYEAYAVGGCVRDSLMERVPEDWDITTSASPYQVKEIFHRTIDTGIQHGTVTVMLGSEGFEVTTYRIDGEYEDNRHPKQVEFTKNLIEDLKRRDFTINAMAYNEIDGLVDCFGGLEDLNHKIIRCVGSAADRFDEDALRILRAVRFSAQLDFNIEEQTLAAVREKVNHLSNISAERIRVEINKLLLSGHPEKIVLCYETGITKIVLPEFDLIMETDQQNKYHIYTVGMHTVKSLVKMKHLIEDYDKKKQLILCWSILLHDIGKPQTKVTHEDMQEHYYGHAAVGAKKAKEILRRLKFDNETIDMTTTLIRYHDYQYGLTSAGMRKAINKIGAEAIELLFILQEADILTHNPEHIAKRLEYLKDAKTLYKQVMEKKECVNLKMLNINGTDLITHGYIPGKELGELLVKLLDIVLEEPERNTKEELIRIAMQICPPNGNAAK